MDKAFKHNVIAIVYDFDGTLTPQPMQEYTILPEIGIRNGRDFWKEVNAQAEKSNGEPIAAYMRLMLEKARAEFEQARKTLEVTRRLESLQSISELEVAVAEARMDMTRAEQQALNLKKVWIVTFHMPGN